MADGFLGRWSRRKIAVQEGKPLPEETLPAPEKVATKPADTRLADPSLSEGAQPAAAAGVWGQPNYQSWSAPAPQSAPLPEAPPPPTLDDVQALTPASDFKPFMSAQVSPEVRNAAMKKLFADPHFNVMDGLDIYIDDYTQPDPLPKAMMRQMASAQFLGLFDDEKKHTASKDDVLHEMPASASVPAQAQPLAPADSASAMSLDAETSTSPATPPLDPAPASTNLQAAPADTAAPQPPKHA